MYKNKFLVPLFFLFGIFSVSLAQDFPSRPNKLVNDYTQTLTAAEVQQLEQKLVAFDDSTTIQIAVVIMKSTGGYDIADYGVRLAQRWGIGSEENDTGILVLVALGDRAVTIQTGYGVEGAVPDAIAYRIIENEIKPAFRQENYYQGLQRATDALIAYTKGEYKANPPRRQRDGGSGGYLVLMIIIFVVIISLISRRNNDGNGGEVMGRRGASDAFWWAAMLGGMGRGGRGGGFGGGGFGSGGGFGGGFGGFGGGGFGGGGASGRW